MWGYMRKTKKYFFILTIAIILACTFVLNACTSWQKRFNTYAPDFDRLRGDSTQYVYDTKEQALAAGGGWFWTVNEDFSGYQNLDEFLFHPESNPYSPWVSSPHSHRIMPELDRLAGRTRADYELWQYPQYGNWWCEDMLRLHTDPKNPKNNFIRIQARQFTQANPHVCSKNICPAAGRMSSGIETRLNPNITDGSFNGEQAFGFYEAEVLIPNADGLWSAFWLQARTMGNIGNDGRDGSEIDIFESSFRRAWLDRGENLVGICVHWDGYAEHHRSEGRILPVSDNLYDSSWHTFALKWTPWEYVFYVNGVAVYASDWGGISRVNQYMRFTTEVSNWDDFSKMGPYGQPLGFFRPNAAGNTDFLINSVRVLQHTDFLEHIMSIEDF